MSPDPTSETRAAAEAAQWFARLNAASVSTAELGAFRTWRQNPANDRAYAKVAGLWRDSAPLAHDPDVAGMLADARTRNRPERRKRAPAPIWLAWALGAPTLAAVVAAALLTAPHDHTYETAVGEQSTVALEDGSKVKLDTHSRIRVHFSPNARFIALERGQAFFDVVHLPNRPLQVRVGDTEIRDLGTRFDVRRDDGHVRITVVEGAVQVAAASKPARWTLTAGEQMVTGPALQAPYRVDPTTATSWTSGRLVFNGLSLSQATAEMNRYGQHKLILQAGPLDAVKINGAFDSGDTAAFVAAVTRLYGLKAMPQPDGSILLSNPALDRPS